MHNVPFREPSHRTSKSFQNLDTKRKETREKIKCRIWKSSDHS